MLAPPPRPRSRTGSPRTDVLLVAGAWLCVAGPAFLVAAADLTGDALQVARGEGGVAPAWVRVAGIVLPLLGAALATVASVRLRPPWSGRPEWVRIAVEVAVVAVAWEALLLLFLPLWRPLTLGKVFGHAGVVGLLSIALGVGNLRTDPARRRLRRAGQVAAGLALCGMAGHAAFDGEHLNRRFPIGAIMSQIVFWSLGIVLLLTGLTSGRRRRRARHPTASYRPPASPAPVAPRTRLPLAPLGERRRTPRRVADARRDWMLGLALSLAAIQWLALVAFVGSLVTAPWKRYDDPEWALVSTLCGLVAVGLAVTSRARRPRGSPVRPWTRAGHAACVALVTVGLCGLATHDWWWPLASWRGAVLTAILVSFAVGLGAIPRRAEPSQRADLPTTRRIALVLAGLLCHVTWYALDRSPIASGTPRYGPLFLLPILDSSASSSPSRTSAEDGVASDSSAGSPPPTACRVTRASAPRRLRTGRSGCEGTRRPGRPTMTSPRRGGS
jgi:hypothetical protein